MPELKVELKAGDTWVDVTDDVRVDPGVSMKWGASDGEQSNRSPAMATLVFRNHEGRFSPLNPESDLFGYLGRDTEIRITVDNTRRFQGWANTWQPKWGVSDADHEVEVEVFGVRQRLGANPLPLKTALERGVPQLPGVVGYWPMTGGKYTRTYPDITGYCGDAVPDPWKPDPYGSVHRGEYTDDVLGQLPVMKGAIGIRCTEIPTQPSTGYIRFLMWTKFPEQFDEDIMSSFGTSLFYFATTSNIIRYWELQVSEDGSLRLMTYDPEGNLGPDSGWWLFDVRGKEGLLWIQIQNNGSGGVDWQMGQYENVVGAPIRVANGTINGAYTGAPVSWYISHVDTMEDYPVGHVVLENQYVNVSPGLTRGAEGYDSERAATRFNRLCQQENIPVSITDGGLSQRMGHQTQKTLLQLLDDCANAEDAVMYDSPLGDGLRWKSMGTLLGQDPVLELDYAGGQIVPPLDVIVDDKGVTNDVSITQEFGTMRQHVDYDGPMGVNKIGRYAAGQTLNLWELPQIIKRAQWEVAKGTAEGPRISRLTVDLTTNPELVEAVEAVEPGDFLVVKNLPRRVASDPVKLLVVGVQEDVGPVLRRVTFVTVPGSPYDVGWTWNDSDPSASTNRFARADLDGSTVAAASDGFVTGTDTALVVDVPHGQWTTDAGDLPFDIRVGGAVLTVTDVSAMVDGQQGFVVSTTVKNGVVKELKEGDAVHVEPVGRVAIQ